MFLYIKALFISLSNPKIAAILASIYIGRPDLADDLVDICQRESKCLPIKTHNIDAHISSSEWHGQTRLGTTYRERGVENMHLDKRCQKKKASGGWATHGPWGISAGAHWNYLPPCYQPEDVDNIYISALVSARKYERECWETNTKHLRRGWCRVSKSSRKNNNKSPKRKNKRKIKRPKNWLEFFLKNP